MPKLVIISDTHRCHRDLELPEGDILIHCGDIGIERSWQVLFDFNQWLGEQPHKHKIVIPGNHDLLIESAQSFAKQCVTNAHFLIDEEVVIDGYKFYGSPWQPEFCNWAWNLPRGSALRHVWSKIPDDTDVLITHGPPFGILDKVYKEEVGCIDLLERVKEIKPKVHCFGHIHEHGGETHGSKGTLFVNAACVRDRYIKSKSAVVVNC